jgi:hypothetical protein
MSVFGPRRDRTTACWSVSGRQRTKWASHFPATTPFGDEQLWTDVLRLHEVIATVDPLTALAVGLKVDVEALPRTIIAALRAG